MIAILTDPGVGGTFLNWTIHYLSGHSHYYSAKEKQLLAVIDNPLTDINSHKFLPNQATTSYNFKNILENLLTDQSPQFKTIYFHHFIGATDSYHPETAAAIKELLPHVSKTILLTAPSELVLYQCNFKSREKNTPSNSNSNIILTNDNDRFEDFVSSFFPESKKIWDSQQLTDIWDIREFLALNFRPFNSITMTDNLDLAVDHYHINTIELWDRFDQSVDALFEYLDVKINLENFKRWIDVYNQWKKLHKDRLFFSWYFDIIIQYIIDGYNFDLRRFNLDLYQEAAIQHALIYKHGLNLKTWQLEKFTSTQQLHALLEPSTHSLTQY